jgi:glutaredoxin-related protein
VNAVHTVDADWVQSYNQSVSNDDVIIFTKVSYSFHQCGAQIQLLACTPIERTRL